MKILFIIFLMFLIACIVTTVFSTQVLIFFSGDKTQSARFFITLYTITSGWFGALFFMLFKSYFISLFNTQIDLIDMIRNSEDFAHSHTLLIYLKAFISGLRSLILYNFSQFFFIGGTHILAALFWFGALDIGVKKNSEQKNNPSQKEKQLVSQAEARLNAATQHLLMMPEFPSTKSGVDRLKSQFISAYKVQLWVTPFKDPSGLIIYAIKAGGIYHDIKLLFKQDGDKSVLEFWIVQIVGDDWANVTNRIEFKVVEVKSKGLERHIVVTKDQFSSSVSLPDGRTLTLPVEDEKFLYQLNPSGFPKHFKKSGLSEVEIYIDEKGRYRRSGN